MNRGSLLRATVHSPAFSISSLQEVGAETWDRYVESSPAASIYHLSRWRGILEELYRHETYYPCVLAEDGQLVGVLPLVRLRSRLFGDYVVSVPYFNYGGAVADTEPAEEFLLRHGCELVQSLGARHIEFRDCRPRMGWPHVRTDKVVMVLPLPDTPEALAAELGSKVRAQFKRPMKEGAATIFGGEELLDDFYAVFTRNMRDLGTPVYSKRFFAKILETFPEQSLLAVVRLGGKPVAAGFLMSYRNTMEIPWASSLREANRLSVNMLLYWGCLEKAIQLGRKEFDFGRSSVGSGTYKFKAQWGAQPRLAYWHYWLNDGVQMPNLTTANPRYQLAIRIWRHLPLFVTNTLGPHIVKNLP